MNRIARFRRHSEVERRILSNCAIKVSGRLESAEAERPEYGFLPPAQRARAMLAKPGTMFHRPARHPGAHDDPPPF